MPARLSARPSFSMQRITPTSLPITMAMAWRTRTMERPLPMPVGRRACSRPPITGSSWGRMPRSTFTTPIMRLNCSTIPRWICPGLWRSSLREWRAEPAGPFQRAAGSLLAHRQNVAIDLFKDLDSRTANQGGGQAGAARRSHDNQFDLLVGHIFRDIGGDGTHLGDNLHRI